MGNTGHPLYLLFKVLMDVLCYPLSFLDAQGKAGGIVAGVLGLTLLAVGFGMLGVSLWGMGVMMVGLAYCTFCVSRFVGLQARLQREYDELEASEAEADRRD